jgi:hypothetical protein
MKYLSYEEMEKLSTKRLLAYKKKHLNPNNQPKCNSWCTNWIIKEHRDQCIKDCGQKHYDDLLAFETAYNNIKQILSTREHVR